MDNTLKGQIDKLIDKHSGSELWIEAVRLAIKSNPTIAQEVLYTIRDIKQEQAGLYDKEFGESKDGAMRIGMRMPVSIDNILMAVDPDTFPINKLELPEQKKAIRKLTKAFPEFCIARY